MCTTFLKLMKVSLDNLYSKKNVTKSHIQEIWPAIHSTQFENIRMRTDIFLTVKCLCFYLSFVSNSHVTPIFRP